MPPGSSILYDQFGTSDFGWPSQDFEPGLDVYDSQIADDFTVPDAEGWTVTQVNVQGSFTFSPTALANVWVYADNAGVPGTAVCTHMNQAVVDDGSGNLEIELAEPCELSGSGTSYWLVVQARKDFDPDGQWFWSTVLEGPFGANAQYENPGDGFVTGCTSWAALVICFVDANLDMGFQIAGTLGTGGETEPGTRTRTTFRVTKYFADGNNLDEVTVSIDCNTGLILDQDKDLENGEWVEFVVTSFTDGALNCTIEEEAGPSGYMAEYEGDGDEGTCTYTAVTDGSAFNCDITNTPDYVNIVVNKEWVIAGDNNNVNLGYYLEAYCNNVFIEPDQQAGGDYGIGYDYGEGPAPGKHTFPVKPAFPSSTCYVNEYGLDSAIEVDNGCQGLTVSAGAGASCTITNTVFFEGIPTLSQYGKLLLVLLMLGLGFVSFRRFS